VPRERDVFANFERMRREIDELFGDVFERTGLARGPGFQPAVDVYYRDQPPRAVAEVELAGVHIGEVTLEIRGRELVIEGERRGHEAAGRLYQQIEIEQGPFFRTVELGADVVADEATATYVDGILRVEIPLRGSEQSVRQVPIRTEDEPEAGGA
jgi:HSP20 family protein